MSGLPDQNPSKRPEMEVDCQEPERSGLADGLANANPSKYPRTGTCANCGRKADDLFWHEQDDALYCTDVFECEGRFEALADQNPSKRPQA